MSVKKLQVIVSHPFFRSSVLVTLFSFIASIFSYLFNVIVVKAFPVASYGEYAAANSYIGFLSVPIVAFGSVIIRRIGRESKVDRVQTVLNLEFWLQGQLRALSPIALVGVIILGLISTRIGNISHISFGFIILSLGLLLFQNFYGNALQSFQWFGRYGIYLLLMTITKVLLGGVILLLFPTLFGLYGTLLLTALGSIFLGRYWTVGSHSPTHEKARFGNVLTYLRSKRTIVPLITTVGLIGLSSVDVIIAKAVLDPSQAGLYGTLSLLSKIILFVTTPMSSVAFVFFTDSDHRQKGKHLLLLGLLSVGIVGIGAVIVYALFPTIIIRIVASTSYLEIAPALWAGAVFGTIYSMVTMFGNFFISKNQGAGQASILAVLVQIVLLLFFHATLLEMMFVNIFACFLLLLFYVMVLFRSAH